MGDTSGLVLQLFFIGSIRAGEKTVDNKYHFFSHFVCSEIEKVIESSILSLGNAQLDSIQTMTSNKN